MMRSISWGMLIAFFLLTVAVMGLVWGVVESRTVYASGERIYDNPFPPMLMYGFGLPGLVILGISLLVKRSRVARIAGVACLVLAATPLAIAVAILL